eukprot:766334-Hanusia_phi.AAC.2
MSQAWHLKVLKIASRILPFVLRVPCPYMELRRGSLPNPSAVICSPCLQARWDDDKPRRAMEHQTRKEDVQEERRVGGGRKSNLQVVV